MTYRGIFCILLYIPLMQESVVEYLRGKQLYLSRYDHCGSLGYSAIYRIALNFYSILIYVTV